ncbi:MAG: hypothetical protein IPG57_00885 [Burkholderiales bacterium]|nr:hypothetical protein [Burkholderiales bacterium]MBP7519132.1 hypothetical protein [Leptothrix sp. (in: b-proteobacteria)]
MAALKHPFGSRTRIAGAAVAALSLAWLAASCGGGGGGDSDDTDTAAPTQISADTVKTAAADASSFVSLCNPSSTSAAAPRAGSSALVSRALGLAQMQRERRLMQGRMQAMAAGDPLVENGDCGGKYEMTEDSSGGTTSSGALVFTNYCELNTDTGAQEVVSGSVTLSVTRSTVNGVNVTSRIAAESPDGLRTQVRAASGGAVLSDESVSFSGLAYQVGVPGGSPTSASPDRFTVQEMLRSNNLTGKTYRQANWSISSYDTPSGGSSLAMSGRGHRSNGESFEIATPTRIETDSTGAYTAGALTFSGANGSQAVVTLVPGVTMQATLTVNGTPYTEGLPACAN